MNERHDDNLERRLADWLESHAPRPAADMADRMLRQTALESQSGRGWLAWPVNALAIAGVAAVAVVTGLAVAQLLASPVGEQVDPTPSPSVAITPTTAATPRAQVTPEPSSPIEAAVRALFETPDTCFNEVDDYRIDFPEAWYTNTAFSDFASCRFFHPTTYEAAEGEPPRVAIAFEATEGLTIGALAIYTMEEPEELEVNGLPAVRTELHNLNEPQSLYIYRVLLDPEDETGPSIGATVDSRNHPDYETSKAVLDRMMETIQPMGGICGEEGSQYVCGQIIVGLEPDAPPIEEVMLRNRSDPERDLLGRIGSLDAYVILVAVGHEAAAIQLYASDPAVRYADLNGTEGSVAD